MKKFLKNNKNRHFVRIVMACFVTIALYFFLYNFQLILMLLATVVVMLTQTGNAVYQGIIRYFMLVVVVMLLYLLLPEQIDFYRDLNAITLGGTIGIICNVLLFPDRINVEFQRTVIPFLKTSAHYFAAIATLMLTGKSDETQKYKLENQLLKLPTWMYESGFDITLQTGYRYYVMKLNHLAEILFSMHYLARKSYSRELLEMISVSLLQAKDRMQEFVMAINTLLDLKKLKEGVHDFAEDIDEMENQFKSMLKMPANLSRTDHQYFAEFLRDLSELRVVLIQLAKALRGGS